MSFVVKKEYIDNETKKAIETLKIDIYEPIIFGSYSFLNFVYASDIDLFSIVTYCCSEEEAINKFYYAFLETMKKILKNKKMYFIKLRAGLDNNNDYVDWTLEEVIYNKHFKTGLTLQDVFKQHSKIRIEVVYNLFGYLTELSNFIVLKYVNKKDQETYINFNASNKIKEQELKEEFNRLIDINDKKYNVYKATKRLFSICRLLKDIETENLILPLLTVSQYAPIYKVKSNIDAIITLLTVYEHKAPYEQILNETTYLKDIIIQNTNVFSNTDFINILTLLDNPNIYNLTELDKILFEYVNNGALEYYKNNNIMYLLEPFNI